MLNPQDKPSPPLSDRELELISNVARLRDALRTTLNYIEAGLQPVLPAHIEQYRALLEEVKPEVDLDSVSARELFDVVTAMVRFLSLTSADEAFSRNGISGLVDWTIMMTLTLEPPGVTDRQITRIMGANYKRIQRMTQSLAVSDMVRVTQIANNGTCAVEITPGGQVRLDETNEKLERKLRWFTQRERFRLMFLARKIRLLARMYDERPAKKK
jgi:hypothetical protein